MKYIISVLLLIGSTSTFAGGSVGTMSIADTAHMGGSGGGGVLSGTKIVYHMGQKNGLVTFAYGQLVENKWQIEKFEMAETELDIEPVVMKALRNSKSLNSWAEVR